MYERKIGRETFPVIFHFNSAERELSKVVDLVMSNNFDEVVIGSSPRRPAVVEGRVGTAERRTVSYAAPQTLEGSFSAVSKPNFASKYAFESSRRDLDNALRSTAFHSSSISIFSSPAYPFESSVKFAE